MRNNRLDLLRFLGVILVMFRHLDIYGDNVFLPVFRTIAIGGWIGVDLFFVLSGFLVSGLIFNEFKSQSSFDPKRFLIRRGLKIYPAYYLFLAISFTSRLILTPTHTDYNSVEGLLNESIFVSNYFRYNNPWLWSICVEEHFYLLLAVLLFLLIKLKKLSLPALTIAYIIFLVGGLYFRLQNYYHYTDYNFDRDYSRSHFRFDSLFFGVLLSYLWNFKPSYIKKIVLGNKIGVYISIIILSINFLFPISDNRWTSVINLSLNPICFGYLLVYFLEYKKENKLSSFNFLAILGKYSYCIYLFHGFINDIVKHFFSGYMYYLLYFSLTFIIGIVMSKVVEYPILKYRDKFYPSKSKLPLVSV